MRVTLPTTLKVVVLHIFCDRNGLVLPPRAWISSPAFLFSLFSALTDPFPVWLRMPRKSIDVVWGASAYTSSRKVYVHDGWRRESLRERVAVAGRRWRRDCHERAPRVRTSRLWVDPPAHRRGEEMIIDESLSVAASADQLGVVRAHVRTVAADRAFAADDLTDLVLAVDEAAGILLDHSVPCSALTCVVAVEGTGVRVHLAAATTAPINSDMTFFGWFVVRALVDAASVDVEPVRALGEKESWAVTITLKKAPNAQR